ncbi:la-related protein 7 [Lucilia cuprina]|uniref:la-related protein 7 n=1 Tax=Lucilia cuprina TaxID=7375 RepID=UPI001F06171F|nr:la-related protein 7 [Lucilia cuprina]
MGTKNKHKKNTKQKEQSTEENKQDVINTNQEIAVAEEVTNVSMAEEPAEEGEHKKSYRKRKRHYYNAIRAQMEFYFGDANLTKDRFLKQQLDKDPYVPLEIFMTFNKMKALTSKVEDIAKSLNNSELLELDETQQKVRRKIPLAENRNVDEKTLYVEALPSTADHEWVRQIFERFGKVAYISLPKYSKSRKIKEFGFVEFEKEDSVNKAIKAFKEFNGVLSMQEKDPSDLTSVKSYIKEQSGEKEEEDTSSKATESRKRNKNDDTNEEIEPKAKKSKTETQDDTETLQTDNATTSQSESEIKAEGLDDQMVEEGLKKKKRKRKKKSKTTESLKLKAELNTDVAYYELKILPKRDWKRLRNKYLNLQREKVTELKRKAWREQQELKQQKDAAMVEDNNSLPAGQQEQKKHSKTGNKHKLQKMNMNFYGAAEEEPPTKVSISEKVPQQNPALERTPLFSYEPGLIVEISFLEPCVNIKEFKADMRQYNSVKYVDVKEGAMQAFLRLESSQKAVEFMQQISCAEYQCKILSDEAEANYWQKIEKDREQKLNKQVKIPQKRGREKVKKLITKHIRFGDDDE